MELFIHLAPCTSSKTSMFRRNTSPKFCGEMQAQDLLADLYSLRRKKTKQINIGGLFR